MSLTLYPLESYTIGVKEPLLEKDTSVVSRLKRMEELYEHEGLRQSVDGVMLVHQHKHPYVLLLQIGTYFKLPGGKLHVGEEEIAGIKRKLTKKLAPPPSASAVSHMPQWEIGEVLSKWWRPNFETHFYPYIPAHVTRPKECKKLYLVELPARCVFAVPKNLKLLAVPLFELYDNAQRYGPIISSIPQQVARFNFVYA
ncbi:cleavage and polyadenylation specificity factor subunit 5 [Pelomyxa schiedti]|nr:cleavage and polyadenylation specificity factor subunit 5 [Pelomyxa schiedti]